MMVLATRCILHVRVVIPKSAVVQRSHSGFPTGKGCERERFASQSVGKTPHIRITSGLRVGRTEGL